MQAIKFDTLTYVKELTGAGVTPEVAEIHAMTVAHAFGMFIDGVVTKDYLDATLDARFAAQDAKFEQRFAEQDAKLEKRLAEQDAKFEKRFNALEDRIAPLELAIESIQVTLRFQSGLLLILVAGLLVPPVLNLINSVN